MIDIQSLKKIIRYIKIYGLFRTLIKVLGRLRPKIKFWIVLKFPFYSTKGKSVGIVGCGHHAFSSIAYYLSTTTNSKISFALDIDANASLSLAYAYNAIDMGDSYDIGKDGVSAPDIVYISSNHATHTDYAIKFLNMGCDVYIEKPLSISYQQLNNLDAIVNSSDSNVYAGYNRPHSPSIRTIKRNISDFTAPMTLSFFITGHFIPDDHWYRDPKEGTRIVANLGHWIDLSIHVLNWRYKLPEYLDVSISYSNQNTPSDNISVVLTSAMNDLINMTFTSRSEPFEGVNETINFQHGNLIAKIDDFRTTKIWVDSKFKKYRHWPKNNGHKTAVLQPFNKGVKRSWSELKLSTRLMLFIENMVINKNTQKRFNI